MLQPTNSTSDKLSESPRPSTRSHQATGSMISNCMPGLTCVTSPCLIASFVQVTCAAGSSNSNPPVQVTSASISEPARKNLANAAAACRRFGWLSFWTQLVLSVVSAIILLFSVAFTSLVSCLSLLSSILLFQHTPACTYLFGVYADRTQFTSGYITSGQVAAKRGAYSNIIITIKCLKCLP